MVFAGISAVIRICRDCLRYCEFGRALVQRAWGGDGRKVFYVGFWSAKHFEDNMKSIRETIYRGWDASTGAPPPARPPDEGEDTAPPSLQILAWRDGAPRWPDILSTRFPEGTEEFDVLNKIKEEFKQEFPQSAAVQQPGVTIVHAGRAGGHCDFAVDNGAQPLDITRLISLQHVSDADFKSTETRPTELMF